MSGRNNKKKLNGAVNPKGDNASGLGSSATGTPVKRKSVFDSMFGSSPKKDKETSAADGQAAVVDTGLVVSPMAPVISETVNRIISSGAVVPAVAASSSSPSAVSSSEDVKAVVDSNVSTASAASPTVPVVSEIVSPIHIAAGGDDDNDREVGEGVHVTSEAKLRALRKEEDSDDDSDFEAEPPVAPAPIVVSASTSSSSSSQAVDEAASAASIQSSLQRLGLDNSSRSAAPARTAKPLVKPDAEVSVDGSDSSTPRVSASPEAKLEAFIGTLTSNQKFQIQSSLNAPAQEDPDPLVVEFAGYLVEAIREEDRHPDRAVMLVCLQGLEAAQVNTSTLAGIYTHKVRGEGDQEKTIASILKPEVFARTFFKAASKFLAACPETHPEYLARRVTLLLWMREIGSFPMLADKTAFDKYFEATCSVYEEKLPKYFARLTKNLGDGKSFSFGKTVTLGKDNSYAQTLIRLLLAVHIDQLSPEEFRGKDQEKKKWLLNYNEKKHAKILHLFQNKEVYMGALLEELSQNPAVQKHGIHAWVKELISIISNEKSELANEAALRFGSCLERYLPDNSDVDFVSERTLELLTNKNDAERTKALQDWYDVLVGTSSPSIIVDLNKAWLSVILKEDWQQQDQDELNEKMYATLDRYLALHDSRNLEFSYVDTEKEKIENLLKLAEIKIAYYKLILERTEFFIINIQQFQQSELTDKLCLALVLYIDMVLTGVFEIDQAFIQQFIPEAERNQMKASIVRLAELVKRDVPKAREFFDLEIRFFGIKNDINKIIRSRRGKIDPGVATKIAGLVGLSDPNQAFFEDNFQDALRTKNDNFFAHMLCMPSHHPILVPVQNTGTDKKYENEEEADKQNTKELCIRIANEYSEDNPLRNLWNGLIEDFSCDAIIKLCDFYSRQLETNADNIERVILMATFVFGKERSDKNALYLLSKFSQIAGSPFSLTGFQQRSFEDALKLLCQPSHLMSYDELALFPNLLKVTKVMGGEIDTLGERLYVKTEQQKIVVTVADTNEAVVTHLLGIEVNRQYFDAQANAIVLDFSTNVEAPQVFPERNPHRTPANITRELNEILAGLIDGAFPEKHRTTNESLSYHFTRSELRKMLWEEIKIAKDTNKLKTGEIIPEVIHDAIGAMHKKIASTKGINFAPVRSHQQLSFFDGKTLDQAARGVFGHLRTLDQEIQTHNASVSHAPADPVKVKNALITWIEGMPTRRNLPEDVKSAINTDGLTEEAIRVLKERYDQAGFRDHFEDRMNLIKQGKSNECLQDVRQKFRSGVQTTSGELLAFIEELQPQVALSLLGFKRVEVSNHVAPILNAEPHKLYISCEKSKVTIRWKTEAGLKVKTVDPKSNDCPQAIKNLYINKKQELSPGELRSIINAAVTKLGYYHADANNEDKLKKHAKYKNNFIWTVVETFPNNATVLNHLKEKYNFDKPALISLGFRRFAVMTKQEQQTKGPKLLETLMSLTEELFKDRLPKDYKDNHGQGSSAADSAEILVDGLLTKIRNDLKQIRNNLDNNLSSHDIETMAQKLLYDVFTLAQAAAYVLVRDLEDYRATPDVARDLPRVDDDGKEATKEAAKSARKLIKCFNAAFVQDDKFHELFRVTLNLSNQDKSPLEKLTGHKSHNALANKEFLKHINPHETVEQIQATPLYEAEYFNSPDAGSDLHNALYRFKFEAMGNCTLLEIHSAAAKNKELKKIELVPTVRVDEKGVAVENIQTMSPLEQLHYIIMAAQSWYSPDSLQRSHYIAAIIHVANYAEQAPEDMLTSLLDIAFDSFTSMFVLDNLEPNTPNNMVRKRELETAIRNVPQIKFAYIKHALENGVVSIGHADFILSLLQERSSNLDAPEMSNIYSNNDTNNELNGGRDLLNLAFKCYYERINRGRNITEQAECLESLLKKVEQNNLYSPFFDFLVNLKAPHLPLCINPQASHNKGFLSLHNSRVAKFLKKIDSTRLNAVFQGYYSGIDSEKEITKQAELLNSLMEKIEQYDLYSTFFDFLANFKVSAITQNVSNSGGFLSLHHHAVSKLLIDNHKKISKQEQKLKITADWLDTAALLAPVTREKIKNSNSGASQATELAARTRSLCQEIFGRKLPGEITEKLEKFKEALLPSLETSSQVVENSSKAKTDKAATPAQYLPENNGGVSSSPGAGALKRRRSSMVKQNLVNIDFPQEYQKIDGAQDITNQTELLNSLVKKIEQHDLYSTFFDFLANLEAPNIPQCIDPQVSNSGGFLSLHHHAVTKLLTDNHKKISKQEQKLKIVTEWLSTAALLAPIDPAMQKSRDSEGMPVAKYNEQVAARTLSLCKEIFGNKLPEIIIDNLLELTNALLLSSEISKSVQALNKMKGGQTKTPATNNNVSPSTGSSEKDVHTEIGMTQGGTFSRAPLENRPEKRSNVINGLFGLFSSGKQTATQLESEQNVVNINFPQEYQKIDGEQDITNQTELLNSLVEKVEKNNLYSPFFDFLANLKAPNIPLCIDPQAVNSGGFLPLHHEAVSKLLLKHHGEISSIEQKLNIMAYWFDTGIFLSTVNSVIQENTNKWKMSVAEYNEKVAALTLSFCKKIFGENLPKIILEKLQKLTEALSRSLEISQAQAVKDLANGVNANPGGVSEGSAVDRSRLLSGAPQSNLFGNSVPVVESADRVPAPTGSQNGNA